MSKRDAAAGSMIHRRSFLTGLATSLIAAPAIVRAASIMPVRATRPIESYLDEQYARSPFVEHLLPPMRLWSASMSEMAIKHLQQISSSSPQA